jgi:hypothetical protein
MNTQKPSNVSGSGKGGKGSPPKKPPRQLDLPNEGEMHFFNEAVNLLRTQFLAMSSDDRSKTTQAVLKLASKKK